MGASGGNVDLYCPRWCLVRFGVALCHSHSLAVLVGVVDLPSALSACENAFRALASFQKAMRRRFTDRLCRVWLVGLGRAVVEIDP